MSDLEKLKKEFFEGFIEAIIFTEHSNVYKEDWDADSLDLLDGYIPRDIYNEDDFEEETLKKLQNICNDALVNIGGYLQEAKRETGYGYNQAGIDFWLTINGHGAGYWDRDELRENSLGTLLTDIVGYNPINLEYNPETEKVCIL